jgi:glutamyl-tRNA reductase
MTRIINMGMNHETAALDVRECLASDTENVAKALSGLRDIPYIREALFISTCNRVEAIFTTEDVAAAVADVMGMLSTLGNLSQERLAGSLYIHEESDAVRHVFRVASSLDSMVLGEPQILGQIKEAYTRATMEKTAGVIVNRLMHRAFHVAKRVRTETGVCEAAVSISYAAVELAKKIFYVLEGKKVLLIGAGEMAELAARHLMGQGVSTMTVANRTFHRAVKVAEPFNAQAIAFEEIEGQLSSVDIVISSTASPEYVIGYDVVKRSMRRRRNRPLFCIDIAVPRDIEPRVNEIENVYLYDIDDLKGVVQLNLAQRRQEAVRAERIVEEEVVKFENWMKTLEVVPTIVSLREKAEEIVRAELKKSSSVLSRLDPEENQAVQVLVRSIAEKVINDPIVFLKHKAGSPLLNEYLDAARRLFKLDEEGGASGEG